MFHTPLGEETQLRLLEVRHAEELFSLVDAYRDDLRKWLPWVDAAEGPEQARAFIESALRQFAANRGFHAGVWHEGRIAGVIGHTPIVWVHRSTSLGYWLGTEFWGRGLMTRACRAVIDHAFFELGLNRVEIRCAVENTRSRAIPERLGFQEEGIARQAERNQGRYLDLVVYGMLAADWRGAGADRRP